MLTDAIVFDFTAGDYGPNDSVVIRLADGRLLEVLPDGIVQLHTEHEELVTTADLSEMVDLGTWDVSVA